MPRQTYHSRRNLPCRRGYLYVAVMGTTLIVTLLVLAGMRLARLHLQESLAERERAQAHLLAASAIEHALATFNTNPDWETQYVDNTEYPATPVAVNGGVFTWRLVSEGAGIRRLDGIGRVGGAQSVYAVTLGSPGNYLANALVCGGDFWCGNYTSAEKIAVTGAPLAINGALRNWGRITADVEAQSISDAGTIVGSQTSPAALRTLPDPDTVFDYYVSEGGRLNTNSIQKTVLSPSSNLLGVLNPKGIYVIDAQGGSVEIKECRIIGTVVVLNASQVSIKDRVNWEPAYPNFPALLVQGPLEIRLSHERLREAELGVNLNPLLTPYQGQTDLFADDEYPSAIAGIIYCTGSLVLNGGNNALAPKFEGVVIAGGSCRIEREASVSLKYDPTLVDNPPPGFGAGNPKAIVPGSWRRIPSE